jgi:hypothetical protein
VLLAVAASADEGNDLALGEGPYVAYLRSPDGQFHRVLYTSIGGLAVAQSDIILGPHADVQRQTAYNLANDLAALDYNALKERPPDVDPLKSKQVDIVQWPFAWADPLDSPSARRWPQGKVPYMIDPSITDAALKAAIAEAASDWTKLGVVEIKPLAEFPPGEILGTHPLVIYSSAVLTDAQGRPLDPSRFHCSAHVGYDTRSPGSGRARNGMYLSNVCRTGNIIHELGHTLGLQHEHTRTDRDAFMTADLSLIIQRVRHNFEKQAGQSLGISYDPCSMLHYSDSISADWSTTARRERWYTMTPAGQSALDTCRKTMDASCGQVNPGQRCWLSPMDVELVRRLYQ